MNIFKCKILYAIVAIFLFGSNSFAAPTISSISVTVSQGQSITISGAGFGSKSSAPPIKLEDFEDGTVGELLSSTGYWSVYSDNPTGDKPQFSANYNRHSYSNKTAKFIYFGSNTSLHDVAIKSGLDFSSGRIYLDYWVRFKRAAPSIRHQIKLVRVGSGKNDSYVYPHWVSENWTYDGGGTWCYGDIRKGEVCGRGSAGTKTHGCPKNEDWSHFQLELFSNDIGSANGGYKLWHDGALKVDVSTYEMKCEGDNDFQQIWLGTYLGNAEVSGLETEIYYDDVYFDDSWSRVEIGDNSIYSSCTHRETQYITAWSGTSITATIKQGSFQDGETAYLFVVDADGNVSDGYGPITIGGGGGDNLPKVIITSPTTGNTYSTSESSINIAGTASDDNSISSVTWKIGSSQSQSASNDSGDWTSWSVSNIPLEEGDNLITVTVTDSVSQTSTFMITVTVAIGISESKVTGLKILIWKATQQMGDSNWKESVVTYCVRLLVEGSYIKSPGNTVRLGFQGRSSGEYAIKKVSIAERDLNGNEGDVIDSTWTKVTFDGNSEATWANDLITVSAGGEKLSDPIPFSIQPGKDYYVTIKIETSSIYLIPPTEYQELYFSTEDHTDDVDWSGTGYSTAQDYHSLSSITATN